MHTSPPPPPPKVRFEFLKNGIIWLEFLRFKWDIYFCAQWFNAKIDFQVRLHEQMDIAFQGQAILFAPTRGTTFQQFVTVAETHFEIEQEEVYDDLVWKLHKEVRTVLCEDVKLKLLQNQKTFGAHRNAVVVFKKIFNTTLKQFSSCTKQIT